MNTLSITLVILAFLFGVGISSAIWSARLSSKNESEIGDLTGSGLIVPVRKKKRRLPLTWQADWWQGFSTEMFGAIVTTIFLGVVVSLVQQNENVETQKEDLTFQMGSPDNAFAIEAVRIIDYKGWLRDGSLVGARLRDANLSGARLFNANLSEAFLSGADLMEADLRGADLSGASLSEANLTDADLLGADLRGADLAEANLSGANLSEANLSRLIQVDLLSQAPPIPANLRGANLSGANLSRTDLSGALLYGINLSGVDLSGTNLNEAVLRGANLSGTNLNRTVLSGADLQEANLRGANLNRTDLSGADLSGADLQEADLSGADLRFALLIAIIFNKDTILPDNSKWTPETDLTCFTDPNHPDFWQPE
jgi:uncharacterized protein YjbI with pentapeptide repeats